MKSYTDIEQSRKLSEFLSIESADMDYIPITNIDGEYSIEVNEWDNEHVIKEGWIPCWSLGALLNVLPYPSLHKTFSGWRCDSYNKEGTSCKLGEPSDNPVDACYEMILKLYELKML
jgi:hypothetical protein